MKFLSKYKAEIIFVGLTLIPAFIVAFLSGNFGTYDSLIQPPLSPPAFLFPVVWSILYVLMGLSAARIAKSGDLDKGTALKLYFLQLLVNLLWTPIFFRFGAIKFALFWLLLLILLVIVTFRAFRKIDKKAALFLIPYIIWLLFAFYLNFGVIILNS